MRNLRNRSRAENPDDEIWIYDGLNPIGFFVRSDRGFDAFTVSGTPLGRFPAKDSAIAAISEAAKARAANGGAL